MTHENDLYYAGEYPEEWTISKEEAKKQEEIDKAMRLKIKKVLQET